MGKSGIAVLAVILCATGLRAQEGAPIVLELPASTRALALGGAYAVADPGPDAIFYNPALLTSPRGVGVAVQRWGGGATLGSFAAAMEMEPGGLGVGVRLLDYRATASSRVRLAAGRREALFEEGPIPGSELVASVGYARPVWGVRVGAAGKLVAVGFDRERADAFAVDVGAATRVGPALVSLAVQDLAVGLGDEPLRRGLHPRVTLGASHSSEVVGPLDVTSAVMITATEGGDVVPAGGLEVAYWPELGKTFVARLGVRRPDAGAGPLTLGGAFIGDRFAAEYAYERLEGGAGAHRFGVRWMPR